MVKRRQMEQKGRFQRGWKNPLELCKEAREEKS